MRYSQKSKKIKANIKNTINMHQHKGAEKKDHKKKKEGGN